MIYDAEHFFDGFADDPSYALACLRAAAEAGAETVVCCDTNGGTLPDGIAEAMADGGRDAGPEAASRSASTATTTPAAASPTRSPAVRAGATHVQGTINGYGERCGNANLVDDHPQPAAEAAATSASPPSSSRR